MKINPLPKLGAIPIKDRMTLAFVQKGELDVLDGTFVQVDSTGIRKHIPVGGVLCSNQARVFPMQPLPLPQE